MFFYYWFINDFFLSLRLLEVLFILNLAALPLQKICAKCHVSDIIVATTNCHVHYNVWCENNHPEG
jgi:hypothetical protein